MNSIRPVKAAAVILAAAIAAAAGVAGPGDPASRTASNLDYWLGQATTATTPAGEPPAIAATNPFGSADRFQRTDAVPGVIVLSDGTLHAGGIFTTRDKDLEIWIAETKRWRHVPLLTLLSLEAVIVSEGMELEWRWKEMGLNEKVYTGRKTPVRRFLWRAHLIDGSYLTGAIKGQPLWVETAAGQRGPLLLHERSDGKYGQTLEGLVYVKRVVVSRRAMKQARKLAASATQPTP